MMFQGCTRCVWNCMNILLLFSAWKRAHSNHDRSQWNQKLNYHCNRPESLSSWWFQPVWKICSKNRIISPGFRVKIKISELPPPSHILNLNWVGKSGWERPHEEFFKSTLDHSCLTIPLEEASSKETTTQQGGKWEFPEENNETTKSKKRRPNVNSFLNWSNKFCNTWRFWNYINLVKL